MNATTIPPSITVIWCFCVWLTARVPPATVYRMTRLPMATQVRFNDQPSSFDSTMAGA